MADVCSGFLYVLSLWVVYTISTFTGWNVVNWEKVSENCAYVVENHAGVPVEG